VRRLSAEPDPADQEWDIEGTEFSPYIEMDGTGIPVVAAETEGRAGKIEGQPPRTREVKLGCVFPQTLRDYEGRPIRAPDSTTYTGAIQIVDLYHAREHLRQQKGR